MDIAFFRDQILNLHVIVFAVLMISIFSAATVIDIFFFSVPLMRPIFGIVVALILPGLLFLRILRIEVQLRLAWAPYIVGASMVITMASWFVVNGVLPYVGYDSPISFLPLFGGLLVALTILAVVSFKRSRNSRVELALPTLDSVSPIALFYAIVPLTAIHAVTYLNSTGETAPIIAVLVLIAISPVLIVGREISDDKLVFIVWTLALALLYHKSLYTAYTFGGHISVVTIWQTNVWPMAGETLLPNAILMPGLAHLLGINILTQVKVVLPFIVSFIPVSIFLMSSHVVERRKAFLAACFFMFSHPFYLQYPSVPRASVPVLFLAFIGTATLDDRLSNFQSHTLALFFALGLAVSHYGTAYYVMIALGMVTVTLIMLANIDRLRFYLGQTYERLSEPKYTRLKDSISPKFALLYSVFVVGWYSNIGGGGRFDDLVQSLYDAYLDVFVLRSSRGGSTASRLNADYGSLSIFLSKHLYLVIAAIVGLGLATATLRRVRREDTTISDGFLLLSLHIYVVFGGSLIIAGAWGGGRPMMIVLGLGSVYCVIGVEAVVSILKLPTQKLDRFVPEFITVSDSVDLWSDGGKMAIGTLLAVFLLLNTGVMAGVAYGGEAPSMVPARDQSSIHKTTDIQTHVWFAIHRDEQIKIYGDQVVWAQSSDWMNGEIAARTGSGSYRFKRQNLGELNRMGIEDGYVILLGHNVVEGTVARNWIVSKPIDTYDLDLGQRSKIYSTGKSAIYYSNTSAS